MRHFKYYLVSVFFLLNISASSQILDSTNYFIQSSFSLSNSETMPFWFISNKEGTVPLSQISNSLLTGINKRFDYGKNVSLKYQITTLTIIDNKPRFFFHNAFIESKIFFITCAAGIKPIAIGNQSALSMGGLIFSGNSSPMPTIEAGIKEYEFVPYTFHLLEVKGNIGNAIQNDHSDLNRVNVHYKSAFIRVGGNFPVNIDYGLIHAVQWGGNSTENGQLPNKFKDFLKVFWGSSGDDTSPLAEKINKLGNHIISQNIGISILVNKKVHFRAYWQNINEDGPIDIVLLTRNRDDKLLGFELNLTDFKFVETALFEYLNTTDQSGPYHDKDGVVYGGTDNYYNNYLYKYGWSYRNYSIGNPMLTSPVYNKNGSIDFENNRVKAYHFALKGEILGYKYCTYFTKSNNYGSYFNKTRLENKSFLLEIKKPFKDFYNIEASIGIALDRGNLYGNSNGVQIGFVKNGLITH